jgi:glyoxylase-like metal-dependent hydrolase (beta-lactamase superfamily II)
MSPRVTPLCCGSIAMDAGVELVGEPGRVEAPSTVFLIEAAETILVDTGFGDPERTTDAHPGFECHRTPDRRLRRVLDDEGYAPADVDTVVFTHLDWDHCHNLGAFGASTEFVVQRAELSYAADPYPPHEVRYEAGSGTRRPPWRDRDLTPIAGETEVCPGVEAFPTPGHTVGHQSVAVETDSGTTVIAADAVPTFENVDRDAGVPRRLGGAVDQIAWWESAAAVLDRGGTILPGHDWAVLDAEPVGLVS